MRHFNRRRRRRCRRVACTLTCSRAGFIFGAGQNRPAVVAANRKSSSGRRMACVDRAADAAAAEDRDHGRRTLHSGSISRDECARGPSSGPTFASAARSRLIEVTNLYQERARDGHGHGDGERAAGHGRRSDTQAPDSGTLHSWTTL
jgi:hypothetical protein